MREIRRAGKVIGAERIAVMAALNITHELHNQQRNDLFSTDDSAQIQQLVNRVQETLDASE